MHRSDGTKKRLTHIVHLVSDHAIHFSVDKGIAWEQLSYLLVLLSQTINSATVCKGPFFFWGDGCKGPLGCTEKKRLTHSPVVEVQASKYVSQD